MLNYLAVAVAGYLLSHIINQHLTRKRIVTVSDTYEAPTTRQTPTQLGNACAVKIADQIRMSDALDIKETAPGVYNVTLRVIK
jgi:hypothetical protein